MQSYIKKIQTFFRTYERSLSSIALIGGFILDSLTLRRVDLLIENLVLGSYIIVAAFGIMLLNLYRGGVLRGKLIEKTHQFLPIIIQFAFGGLFSGFLVFYSRSASFFASWPFLLVLAVLFIGNEVFKKKYIQLTFQLSVFFFVLFSYFIFYIPVLTKKMGDGIFILSGIISLGVIFLFFYILFKTAPLPFQKNKKYTIGSIIGIYLFINLFYFTNIIPPLPLSLKEVGVYHSVVRVGNSYHVEYEPSPKSVFKRSTTIHVVAGQPVYVFSAVFAPTALNTSIVHHWQYYNETSGKWVTSSKIPFSILGGRDGGYRGYTRKSNIFPGKWRVTIENARGQTIGRTVFTVEQIKEPILLETKIM